jgi:carboxymethylenebutenolidase
MCDINNCKPQGSDRPTVAASERSLFMQGLMALPLVTFLADVDLAHAEASKGVMITESTSTGQNVSAYFAKADNAAAPVVILIHECWGLNDNIKAMAEDIHATGSHALAIDLFNGSVATERNQARAQTWAVKGDEANATISHWVRWVKAAGNGKTATLGWCFGGGWSLNAAVIYYGRVTAGTDELAKLQAPSLGHFDSLDKSINPEMVGAFQRRLRAVDKQDLLTTHWYTAGHAFANPTGGRYDQDDAALA